MTEQQDSLEGLAGDRARRLTVEQQLDKDGGRLVSWGPQNCRGRWTSTPRPLLTSPRLER